MDSPFYTIDNLNSIKLLVANYFLEIATYITHNFLVIFLGREQ